MSLSYVLASYILNGVLVEINGFAIGMLVGVAGSHVKYVNLGSVH
jgi:hypothetical protein